MSASLAVLVGAIAGFLGNLLTKSDGLSIMALVLVAGGVFAGWTVAQLVGL